MVARMKRLGPVFLACVGAVAACGDDRKALPDAGHGSGSNQHDAAIDSAPLTAVVITNTGSVPDIYEYRDGNGDWQAVDAPDANGHSTIHVAKDFAVLALCAGDGSAVSAAEVYATVADNGAFIRCVTPAIGTGSAEPTFPVTGTMAQAGSLTLSRTASGTTSPWAFTVHASSGTYDAAAFDPGETKMLLRRGITVADAPLVVTPTFDLVTEGAAINRTTPTVANLASGVTIQTDTLLLTQTSFFDLGAGSGSGEILTAPESLLAAGDFEEAEYIAFTATTEQVAILLGPSSGTGAVVVPSVLTMLPPITGITFSAEPGARRASWTAPPSGGDLRFDIFNQTQELTAVATQNWITATAATSLAFDTSAKGFKNIWFIDTTKSFFAELSESSFDPATNAQYTTAVADSGATFALRAQLHRQRAEHQRRFPVQRAR